MNSYFASVEQQANPLLRGRPLGVCAYLHPRGCIIAASIEAKERGMKVGMTMEIAKTVAPDAVFVQNEPAKYRSTTSRIFSIFHEVTDTVEHYSIDEAFLDLTGWFRDPAEAAWALARVRTRIYEEVGEWLRCSIGIAPTRFLAKTASKIQKPSGLTVITEENLDSILAGMDLEGIHGVGRRMRRRIEALGIMTPLELKRAPVSNLMNAFGKMGYLLWAKLNCYDVEDVVSESPPPKSVGHSYCVPMRVNRENKVVAVLTKLAEKAARRLRQQGLYAKVVIVSVGFRVRDEGERMRGEGKNPSSFIPHPSSFGDSRFIRLDEVTNDSFTLVGTAMELLHDMWNGKQAVSFLAVTYTEFGEPSGQMSLLRGCIVEPALRSLTSNGSLRGDTKNAYATTQPQNNATATSRSDLALRAIDQIKDRHGDEAILLGRQFGITVDEAPDRVGFRKTDGVEVRPSAI